MSRQGVKVAMKVGESRMQFKNLASAEKYFRNLKLVYLNKIKILNENYPNDELDFTPESLKSIEKIYFDFYENNKFNKEFSKSIFVELLGIYNGFVYVKNGKAKWEISKEIFTSENNKYYLGVKLNSGFCYIDCSGISYLEKLTNNKRRQSIYRDYKKYSD